MLALKLLLRNWRSGELKLLSVSIILAVAVLSGISIFTDRLESTLLGQSNALLGADDIVISSKPINREWIEKSTEEGILQTLTIEFTSMVYAGDEMHLAAIKAVKNDYPLRGQLETSQIPFAIKKSEIEVAIGVPASGEVWVDSRVLPELNINLGSALAIGERELRVTKILIRDPESANPFGAISPRILMNSDDVPSTQVIQAGSNVTYSWLLASDNTKQLESFLSWLKPKLSKHEKIEDLVSNQERLANTIKSGKTFLLFAAIIAVLLAGVAIAIGARQFSDRHTSQVALMKSLGASATVIRKLYFGQLLFLACITSLIGLAVGYCIQLSVSYQLQQIYHFNLQAAHIYPYAMSFISGLVCLMCFALPALWFLPSIPPLKILRRELAVNQMRVWLQGVFSLSAVIALIGLFSADLKLTLGVTLSLIIVILFATVLSTLLLLLVKKYAAGAGGFWRLAFANLQRRKGQSLVQMIVFAIAIMLLVTLTIVRTSLIDEWKNQLPLNAPNHFFVNIAPEKVQHFESLLDQYKITKTPLYPMVRARLLSINGIEPTDEMKKIANALQREINLTQTDFLANDNKLVEGVWWDKREKSTLAGVSVDADTARKLHLVIGDRLDFSVGGLNLTAEVVSVRVVDWKSMRPNFFFIFEPNVLDAYSPTYMTSIYLSPEQKSFIHPLLRATPTIVVIELDRILEQMRSIVSQVSDGIGLLLWLVMMAGCLVLFAAVISSMESRKQEAGLLRALGSSRQLILGSVLTEFFIMGLLAGVVAIIGAEFLLYGLEKFSFRMSVQAHYMYWLITPIGSAFFVSVLGVGSCRRVVTTPPAVVLREAA